MSINEDSSSSVQAIAPESVDVTVARPVPNHTANISEPCESIELDDASIADLLIRPENFVVDPDFIESLYRPDSFHDHNCFSNDFFNASHQQGAVDQQEPSQHPQSESQSGQRPVEHNSWTKISAIQNPGYHVGQPSMNQNTTTQTLNPQFAPAFVSFNNGLYQGTPMHTSSTLSFDAQSGDNNQLLTGPSFPSQNAFEHPHNIANVLHYSLAHVMHHQNELASFHQQQTDGSEGMGHLNNGQSAFPQQQMSIPYQNQNWNNIPAISSANASHGNAFQNVGQCPKPNKVPEHSGNGDHAVLGHDEMGEDDAGSPVALGDQDLEHGKGEGAGRCGRSGRKPAGRKGRPKPRTYSDTEEAIIIEGMYEGVSYAEIGEELGRLGQAVEHKIRRMKAEGRLH